MKVLQVSAYYASRGGGIEIVAQNLARALQQRGHELRWAATNLEESLPADIPSVPMDGSNLIEEKLRFPYPLWRLSAMRRLREAVAWADVVHIHDTLYLGCQGAFWAAGAEDKPVVLTQHIGEVPYEQRILRSTMRAANWLFAQPALKLAHVVVFISETVRRHFGNWAGSGRTALVYNGVDAQAFKPGKESRVRLRRRLGIESDEPLALFVGRFVEKKRVAALQPLARQHPGVQFRFIGRGPVDPAKWSLPNAAVLGHLDSRTLADWYRAADLLVLPSVGEGFPLVVQEAMSCGLPCLVSEEIRQACPPAASLMVSAGPGGTHLDSSFDETLAHIHRLRTTREAVARKARELWSWDSTAGQYERIYQALAA